jgi:MFS family permease
VHTYGQLIAVRLLLGIAEAPFFPGVFYLLSYWYTKKELALRTAVLYSGLVLAKAFSRTARGRNLLRARRFPRVSRLAVAVYH